MPVILRAYGKSKHSQDTDRTGTRAEATDQKGTFSRCSALAQGQNRTIDQALPGTGSSLAECVASCCGRHPTALFPPEVRTFLTSLRNARERRECQERRNPIGLASEAALHARRGCSPLTSHFSVRVSLGKQASADETVKRGVSSGAGDFPQIVL